MERLTFNVGGSRGDSLVVVGRDARAGARPAPLEHVKARLAVVRERYDWDYLWMLAFTALLFFRPQDQIPGLEVFHLAELAAIAGLAAMAVRRLSAGQTITKVNAEVVGRPSSRSAKPVPVVALPGSALNELANVYVPGCLPGLKLSYICRR